MDVLCGAPVDWPWFADDTVLIARTQATLHRLVHLLQHLAAQRGLSLNPHKCQLLLLNATLPISLSKTVTATDPCLCEFCAPFLDIPIQPDSLAPPVPQMDTAKYLGAFISSNSSSTADVNFRCSQASTAFHALSPFFRHPLIHPKKKFQIYSQIVQAILLHEQSPRFIHRLKLPKSTHCTIKLFDRSYKLKARSITEF